jgi:hypothetical protein
MEATFSGRLGSAFQLDERGKAVAEFPVRAAAHCVKRLIFVDIWL